MGLGTIPAVRADGLVGLLFVDGHEDTMPLDVSEDGEAANTEIGLLLGLTGHLMHGPLSERLTALGRDELAMLGPRDGGWRQQFNVGSLRDGGVWMRDCQEVAAAPEDLARSAVDHLKESTRRWWLHVDLDVLDPEEFAAQGLPDVADEPHGQYHPADRRHRGSARARTHAAQSLVDRPQTLVARLSRGRRAARPIPPHPVTPPPALPPLPLIGDNSALETASEGSAQWAVRGGKELQIGR